MKKKMMAAALLWCGSIPVASEARDWPDAGGWSISESEDFCMMYLEYEGKGDTGLAVAIKTNGDVIAHISNSGWSAKKYQEYEITWELLGAASYTGPAFGSGERDESRKGFSAVFNPDFVDNFARATSLRVMRGDIVVDQLSLTGSAAAVAMTRKCVAHVKALRAAEQREKDRLAHIADDPFRIERTDAEAEKYGALNPTPRGNPGAWITPDDYPSSALREKRQGSVGFALAIGPDGSVSRCTLTSSSGSSDLDSETCRILSQRARFEPSDSGKTYRDAVDWRIPE